ncbi:MAG: zinc ribbon domain-containing protein, partial [Clostridia bacterium]|nr:zinc ribbon domain-containing protein [Clostridia bacterium]
AVAAPRAAAPRAATPPRPAQADDGRWKCACGAVNDGNFCPNCGTKRPEKKRVFRCDKCGWTPDDPTKPPKFCPNCGDPFNAGDEI